MKLTTKVVSGNKQRYEVISLTHGDQELEWQPIERTNIEEGLDIFEQINGFWATQPDSWQNSLFSVYLQIHEALVNGGDVYALQHALIPYVKILLDMHDPVAIREWIDFKGNILIPSTVEDDYREDNSTRWTRDKTYITKDYKDFLTLSVTLRVMLPVWGEFIFMTKRELRSNWKEYNAFQLISQANIMEFAGMMRFKNYIATMAPDDEELNAFIVDGISSEDYPEMMLAVTVIRRISIVDIRGLPDKPSAISLIFSYLSRRDKTHANGAKGAIRDKRSTEDTSVESESRISKLERHKMKQPIPDGDIAILEDELRDPYDVAKSLCPDIDLELVRISLAQLENNSQHQIYEPQRSLCQWVLARRILPRSLMLFRKQSVLRCVAITQAILWHRHFYHLAALVSAQEQKNTMSFQPGYSGSQPKFDQEMVEQLALLYPYQRRTTSKNKAQKERNVILETIGDLSDAFKEYEWVLTLPKEWLGTVSRNAHERKYTIPPELRVMIAQLVIRIGNRSL